MGDPDSRAVLSGWLLSDVRESGTHRNRKSICRQTGGTLWHTVTTHCGTQCARHRAATGKQSKPKTCCCLLLTFGHLQWAGTRRYSGVLLQIYNTLRYIMIQRNVSMHCKNWLVTACWVQIRTYSIFHLPAPAVLVLQIYGHLSKTGPTVGFLENWANLGNYL